MTDSLCWTCIHAVPNPEKGTGCSWSRSMGTIPVKGCAYAEKVISPCNNGTHKKQVMKIMTKCPKYERDMKVGYC